MSARYSTNGKSENNKMLPKTREEFFSDLNSLMSEINYSIVSVVIDKRMAVSDENSDLYETAVKQGLELVHEFLRSHNDDNATTITFESRGKAEDSRLRRYFATSGENFKLVLHTKSAGGLGLQFADMMARPIGIRILRPEQPNRAWDVIVGKFYKHYTIVLPK
jgi:hypothetical protein